MPEVLHLKGVALMVYAIIYGFSQSGDNGFYGSLEYLAKWTQSTRQGVLKAIDGLIEANLITKQKTKNGNIYSICDVDELIENYEEQEDDFEDIRENQESKQSLQQPVNKVYRTSKLSLQNNINNIDNNILISFNKICETDFKPNKYINKRIKEILKDYSEDDILMTIKFMYNKWGKTPVKFPSGDLSSKFVNPSCILGKNFDKYYDEAQREYAPKNCSRSEDFNEEDLCDEVF